MNYLSKRMILAIRGNTCSTSFAKLNLFLRRFINFLPPRDFMYFLGMIRLVLLCFLAVEMRTVQAERIVSLAPDTNDMAPISTERRRSWVSNRLRHYTKNAKSKWTRKCVRKKCSWSRVILKCGTRRAYSCRTACVYKCYVDGSSRG